MRRIDPKGNPFGPEAFVFGNEAGERIKRVITAWRNTCRRAGITNLHFHDLRREFASHLMYKGAALHTVSAFLGHANISQTSTYLKTTTTLMRKALERMEAPAEPTDDVAESAHATELQ